MSTRFNRSCLRPLLVAGWLSVLSQPALAQTTPGDWVLYRTGSDSCRFAALPLELVRDSTSPTGFSARMEVSPRNADEANEFDKMRVSIPHVASGDAVASSIDFVLDEDGGFGDFEYRADVLVDGINARSPRAHVGNSGALFVDFAPNQSLRGQIAGAGTVELSVRLGSEEMISDIFDIPSLGPASAALRSVGWTCPN